MKNVFKRGLSLVLSLSLAFSLMAVGASAEEFADMPNGWSRDAVASAVENGLLRGNGGKLNPTGLLTRAQLATVIVRAFGATAEADLSGFTDVKADGWYYSALAKAKGMGVMNGTSSTTMSPDRPISRQEVFVILARALKLADGKVETLNAYKDAESVGAWAVGGTAAMVSAGYVSGSNGYLLPTDNITREQFAQIIYNIFGTYYQTAGVYTNDVKNSLLVNVPDITIKNAKIAGDIVVGDGVGEGDLTLENVSIGGRLVVRGGGVNSIHIKGSTVSSVVVAKENGAVRVVADNSSKVEYINIADGKDDVIIEGKVDTVIVENEAVPVILKDATVDTVQVNGDKAEISLIGSTEVSMMNISKDAEGVKLNKEESTTVGTLNAENNLTVEGGGQISNITGNGKATDKEGEEVKPTKPTTSGGSGGSGGGHSHTYAAEWSHDDTHHWHAATCSHTDQKSGYAEHAYTITSDTATCTTAGEKTETCVCGLTRTTESPAKGHTEETVPAVPATCTTAGKTEGKKCSVCGEVLEAQQEVPATGHTPDSFWTYGAIADKHYKKCLTCGEIAETADHTWNDGEITTPATCAAAGVKTYTCSDCSATKTETVPATEQHTWGEWSKVDDTNHKRTCSVCLSVETAAHTWNGGEITTEPTTTTEGVKTYTCTACGDTKTEVVPKTEEGYILSYEASSSKGIVIRSNIPTTTGKYKLTFASDDGGFTTGISSRNYETYSLLAIFAGRPRTTYTSVDWTETIGETTTTIATLNKSLTVAESGDAIGISEFKATRNDSIEDVEDDMWDMEISVDTPLDSSAAYVLYHYIDANRGSGCVSLRAENGKLVSTNGSSQFAAGNTVYLHILKVSGSVDENGNATLTYTPMGTAYEWTVPAETTE